MREKEGLITSEELFNFYFRTKEEMDRMKHLRTCFMKLLFNGVHRLIFEKLKDFPLGLLYCDKIALKNNQCKGRKKSAKGHNLSKQQCIFDECNLFWNTVKFLNIDSSTFCNFPRMGSNFDDDEMEQVTGLQLLCKIAPLLKNLESLSLKNLRLINDEDFVSMRLFLLTVLKNGGNLKTLILENTGLFDGWNGMDEIFHHLEHLTIHERCPPQTSFILKLTHLKFLELSHVKDVNVASLFKNLTMMEHVSIRQSILCGLDRDIDNSKTICAKLKTLNLQRCNVYSERDTLATTSLSCTLFDLINFQHLEKFVFLQISYIDEMNDFRDSQSLFDGMIEKLNHFHMRVLCLDGLMNITCLERLIPFTNLETLHLHGIPQHNSSLLRILSHFPKLQDFSLDCLDISGMELDQFLLHELSSYDCTRTLRSLNIERWSIYDPIPQTCQTHYSFQFDSIPTLPKLEYLKLVGFCVENENIHLKSNHEQGDLKQRMHVKCPLLSTFIVSSILSNDRSNFKYLKQPVSPLLETESLQNVRIAYPLLHFDFWNSQQIKKAHVPHKDGTKVDKSKKHHHHPTFSKGGKKKY